MKGNLKLIILTGKRTRGSKNRSGFWIHTGVDRASGFLCTASIQKGMDTVEIYHTRRDASKSFNLKRTETQKGMTAENESPAAVRNHS